jgi:hypothetical protein
MGLARKGFAWPRGPPTVEIPAASGAAGWPLSKLLVPLPDYWRPLRSAPRQPRLSALPPLTAPPYGSSLALPTVGQTAIFGH